MAAISHRSFHIVTCLVRVELVANGTRLPGNGRTSNQTMKICTLHLFWLLAHGGHHIDSSLASGLAICL